MSNALSLSAILPILIVLITGMVVLVVDACVPPWKRLRFASPALCLVGIVLAMGASFSTLQDGGNRLAFNGAIVADSFAQACNLLLLLTAALAILIATTYLENRKLHLGEYHVLVLFSTAGAMLMAAANELIVLFVAIEILSVALYVLAGFARTEERSEEAALKYFLLGAFAAGFLLYGIALIYGGSAGAAVGGIGHGTAGGGTTNLTELAEFLKSIPQGPSVMLMTGITLLLVGLGFKAALVPFHMWTPDVYEGAPTCVTAYMAAVAKIGAFAAIIRVFNALLPIQEYWLPAIQVLAVLTMFGGNILAVTQDNVKRMLAYSSIAHAGYITVAVAAMAGNRSQSPAERIAVHDAAMSGVIFYLLAYSLMTMGAFAVLVWLSRRGRDIQTIADLKGLAKTDQTAAYVMLIFMLSLGGIPPTMGFMGKWFIFNATIMAGQTGLAIALAFASIISVYYYLRVAWTMCFSEPDAMEAPQRALSPLGVSVSLIITVAASVVLGVAPNLVHNLMTAATAVIRP